MDQNKLNEIIKSQWAILPENIRELVVSTELETKVNWVAGKYNLSTDQTAVLKQETLFVLLGLVHLMDYTDSLSRELEIPGDRAQVIAKEVGTQIFAGVKEPLKELGWVIEMKRERQGAPAPTPSTPKAPPAPQPQPQQTPLGKAVSSVLVQQEAKKESAPTVSPANPAVVLLEKTERPALITAHAQSNNGTGTIIDQKLGGMTKIPREEVRVDMAKVPPTNTNTPPIKRYTGTDPYRESIE